MRTLLCWLAVAMSLAAADFDELKRNCAAMASNFGFSPAFACASAIFTENTLHPVVRNIAPGAGTGLGMALKIDRPGDWHKTFTASGVVSFGGSWLARTDFTLRRPNLARWNKANESYFIDAYAGARSIDKLPFYGIGPNTSKDNPAFFSHRDTRAGVEAYAPVARGIGLGSRVEAMFVDLGKPTPGGRFLHTELYVRPHASYPFEVDSTIAYHNFHDTAGHANSFHRFRAAGEYHFYPERVAGGRPKRDSYFTLRGLVSASWTGAKQTIPFYMMETLGGSNINNEPTLRSFADYRFWAPDIFLIQAQYDRRLWKYFGVFAFFDNGAVGSDWTFGPQRQSYGFGVSLWAESRVFFRASIAFGGGEGHHTYVDARLGLLN